MEISIDEYGIITIEQDGHRGTYPPTMQISALPKEAQKLAEERWDNEVITSYIFRYENV